jgi:hypothetical protein
MPVVEVIYLDSVDAIRRRRTLLFSMVLYIVAMITMKLQ